MPPSVVFQMPPPEMAANAALGVKRSATTSVTRPPMLYGPSCFQPMPLAAGSTAAACACIWSIWARVTVALELSLRSCISSGVAPLPSVSSASFSGAMAIRSLGAPGFLGVTEPVKASTVSAATQTSASAATTSD